VVVALLSGACMGEEEKTKKQDKENVGTVIGIDLGTTYSWSVQ